MSLVIAARAEQALGKAAEGRRDLAAARKGWRGDPTTVAPALL
jgi:hypothetical protein